MRFAEGRPDHWELAVLPGQDTATLKDGEIFGYPVDAGLGCYMLSFTICGGNPITRSSHQGSEALGYSNAT